MPTTRSQAANANGANGPQGEHKEMGVKRQGSTKQRGGGKRAKKEEGEDVAAGAAKAEPAESKESDAEPAVQNGESKAHSKPASKMSKAEQTQTSADPEGFEKGAGVLERGHIYFFYRPKVELTEAHSLSDVSKFALLLLPRPPNAAPAPEPQSKPHKPYRYLSVGKKRLPSPSKNREVFWAAITALGSDLSSLASELGPKSYTTKTRGERHLAPARLAGRGNYVIWAKTDGPPSAHETVLAYQLSHPSEVGEVQRELEILPSSSFVLQVKNPTVSAPPQAGLSADKRAEYPEEVVEAEFGGEGDGEGLRFVPANPVRLLDYEGAEVLLIADREVLGEAIPEKEARDVERSAEEEGEKLGREEVMREVMMDLERWPAEALEGEWA